MHKAGHVEFAVDASIAAGQKLRADRFLCKPPSLANLKRHIQFASEEAAVRSISRYSGRAPTPVSVLQTNILELD